jgi:hypothetical protein
VEILVIHVLYDGVDRMRIAYPLGIPFGSLFQFGNSGLQTFTTLDFQIQIFL